MGKRSESIPHPPPDLGPSACGTGKGRSKGAERWYRMLTASDYGIAPDSRVLDAGCGTGRMAVPLTDYLTEGSYEGFDIHASAVRWCQENITPHAPNFRFEIADIFSTMYNPEGSQSAEEYKFPYPDNSFDFAFLASVFTHLEPRAVENYIYELGRVLESGGTCVISYFLLNDTAVDEIEAGRIRGRPNFPFKRDNHRLQRKVAPEVAVAHDEDMVRGFYGQAGMKILGVTYGSWARPDNGNEFRQDLVWAAKE